jgi:hypothetical protein
MAKQAAKKAKRAQHLARSLANIPAAELHSELLRRRRRVQPLARRYERLLERAAKVRAEIVALGGSVDASPPDAGVARRRPRNRASLVQTLKTALAGNTLSVEQAMKKVLAAGYRSSSPSFRAIVNRALIKNAQFKRVGRGRYTIR